MFKKYIRRFIVVISIISIFSIFISFSLAHLLDNYSFSGQEENTQQHKSTYCDYKFGVMIYAIALSFLGILNMYNSLEIYKKKEQIDKELSELKESHTKSIVDFNNANLQVKNDYNKIEIELKEKIQKEKDLLFDIYIKFDNKLESNISVLENKFFDLLHKFEKKQNNVESKTADII